MDWVRPSPAQTVSSKHSTRFFQPMHRRRGIAVALRLGWQQQLVELFTSGPLVLCSAEQSSCMGHYWLAVRASRSF